MSASCVLIAVVLTLGFIAISAGYVHCYHNDLENSSNLLTNWISILWNQTTESDFNSGALNNVNTSSSPGNVTLLSQQIKPPLLYALTGYGDPFFYKYNVSNNSWTALSDTPAAVNDGGELVVDNQHYAYALEGGAYTGFWRYNASSNTWTNMSTTPYNVGYGGALCYTGGNYIFALAADSSNLFWRYNISSNSWTAMNNTPNVVTQGGALCYTGGNYIYAFRGGSTKSFWRYNISSDTWVSMNDTLVSVNKEGALTSVGGNYIYAFPGNSISFLRYNISANSWANMSSAPASVGPGAALANDGNYIYALKGKVSNKFWRYDISNDSWNDTAVSDIPSGNLVEWSGSLDYDPPLWGYVGPGTIVSQVLTTNSQGSRWDALLWTSTLPAGTSLTFHVRASNTLFAKNSSTPSWISVGSTSPVYSSLPSGKYMQWQATLTTDNITNTPILQDVFVYYTDF